MGVGAVTIRVDVAHSWSELQDLAFGEPWPLHPGDYHSSLVHRGVARGDWDVTTSLQRTGLVNVEVHLLRNFRKYSRLQDSVITNPWDWLVLAQHHGLPTRLLDLTFSPLIAMHFATAELEHRDRDGCIWSIDVIRLHKALPRSLRSVLSADRGHVFTTGALTTAGIEPLRLPSSRRGYFMILEPPSIDDRIVNQFAAFAVGFTANARFDTWLANFPDEIARKLIIPSALKAEVREKLDQANVTERVVYPGLDGLSAWLRRYYSAGARPWLPGGGMKQALGPGAGAGTAPGTAPGAAPGSAPKAGP